jgi:hypothetical protein
MEAKYKKALIGVGLAVGLYFLFNYVIKKSGAVVVPPKPNGDGFKGMDGEEEGKYTAKRYDSTHKNLDGSLGATWIGYNDSNIVGFWQKGQVDIGTEVKP